jgi:hypothetical protein
VAHDEWRKSTTAATVVTMHVAAANVAGSYSYKDIAGAGNGLPELPKAKCAGRIEYKRLHSFKDNL